MVPYREDIVDVTNRHSCANKSLIGCQNKGSFIPVVGTLEQQQQCLFGGEEKH